MRAGQTATTPDDYLRPILFLLRMWAGALAPVDPPAEVVRQHAWDTWARREDARIARCERGCGEWTYDYPVCRSCRTRHRRPLWAGRRTAA